MQKIVYGISNYKMVQDNDYFYIDKTKYIEELEGLNERFLIFLRPRRFGKSLFLSTLQYYYDQNSKNEFETLFKNTYIGANPTPKKNSYKILFFEFSGIEVDGDISKTYHDFMKNIQKGVKRYLIDYKYDMKHIEYFNTLDNPKDIIKDFFNITKNDKIYLLIDEYDQFANAILAYSMKDFLTIIGKGGFVRSFYEVLKTATFTGTLQKMFITGVTPITLDSLSSGFNIVSNISNRKTFNTMAGFDQQEVDYSLSQSIFKECPDIDKNEILKKIKKWYNGYIFDIEAERRVYNATLVNYFISNFNYDRCDMPKKMLDSNVASDYKAIMRLFHLGDSDRNFEVLQELIEKNSITGSIKDRYDLNQNFSEDDFITLIYSMGFITIKEQLFDEIYNFEIPNYVIKILYFNYFAIEIEKRNNLNISNSINKTLLKLAMGDINPFNNQLNDVIKTLSNRDHFGFKENHFQVITLSLLSFASFYFIDSQPELNRKYPDILLTGRDEKVPNNYLFELKWIKDRDNYEKIKQDGLNQVNEYLELDKVKSIPKLKSYLLIGSKDGVEFIEIPTLIP